MKTILAKIRFKMGRLIQYSRLRQGVICSIIEPNIVFIKNKLNQVGYFFPYSSLRSTFPGQLSILSNGFHKHLTKKYTCDQVSILNTDTVIDCGAFVGGFSVAAAQLGAAKVISIEPSSKNFHCLKLNLSLYDVNNAIPIRLALGSESGTAQLNLSTTGSDNSLLKPDVDDLNMTEEVKVETLKGIFNEYHLEPSSIYLKVEAEGFEPEILKGLGDIRPRVIVVDVTPERQGTSPRQEIEQIMKSFNYQTIIHTERCTFAIL